jgi:molecular chaperone GrpE
MSKKKTTKKCAKCEENLNLAKRAMADYENLKKDTAKWKAEFIKFANQGLISELLPIVDNFSQAMSHVPENQKAHDWVVGIICINKQLKSFLQSQGVESYGKVGDDFNPHLYEAVKSIKSKKQKSGKIVKIIRQGYKIGDRVIRAGQAVVAR